MENIRYGGNDWMILTAKNLDSRFIQYPTPSLPNAVHNINLILPYLSYEELHQPNILLQIGQQ